MEQNLNRILALLGGKVDLPEGENARQELVNRLGSLPLKGGKSNRCRTHRKFLEHFCHRIDSSTDCWNWTGGVNNHFDGIFTGEYGVVWHWGVKFKCHRLSKIIFHHGPTEIGVDQALHTCDNPRCCNPNHIYWGTNKKNTEDCISRGRLHREIGSQRYNAKLTEEQVQEIIREAPNRKYGWGRAKARKFGVQPTAINNIVKGRRWKQVPR